MQRVLASSSAVCRLATRTLLTRSTRSLATAVAKAAPAAQAAKPLAAVLDLELKYEREEGSAGSEATMAEVRADLKSWKFDVVPQQARFSLTKRFGAQDVRLDLDCTPMPADEDEEEDEAAEGDEAAEKDSEHEGDEEGEAPPDGYRMLVTISEAGKASTMQVGCFLGRHLRVHRVTLFPVGKEPSSDVIFGGVSGGVGRSMTAVRLTLFASNFSPQFDELPLYAGPNFDELDQAVQNAFYEYLADRGVDDELAEKLADFAQAKEQSEYVGWLTAARDFAKTK